MDPLLFYGVPEGCSFGSIVALEWSGLDYQLCRVEMPAVVTSKPYRRINPVAETPALRTSEGVMLTQSLAILHHIGTRARGAPLSFAQGTRELDRLNEMLAFLNTNFFESFSPLWYALEHGAEGEARRVLTESGAAKVRKAHADLEALLGDRRWLAGEARTMADAYFMGIARWNDFHRVLDRRQFPRLHRLYSTLAEDPAVHFAHAIEHERPASSAGGFRGHISIDDALATEPGSLHAQGGPPE